MVYSYLGEVDIVCGSNKVDLLNLGHCSHHGGNNIVVQTVLTSRYADILRNWILNRSQDRLLHTVI